MQVQLGALVAGLAKTSGDTKLAAMAAALVPAPVVPPTPKQMHETASAEHRQAIKLKQELKRRQAHFANRRGELQTQLDKVVADLAAAEADLLSATRAVDEKAIALDKAVAATTEQDKKDGHQGGPMGPQRGRNLHRR